MRILAIAASSSRVSLNRSLLEALQPMLEAHGAQVETLDYGLIDQLEHYNFDVERERGLPERARALIAKVIETDGLLIAHPEYNHSIVGTLKNGIDWLSRRKPSPLKGKLALLASASPSLVGGWRGLHALRLPLECLSCTCHPEAITIAGVRSPADVTARLAEPEVATRVREAVNGFAATLAALCAARPPAG